MKLEADVSEDGLNPIVEVYSVKEVKKMVDVTESEDEKMDEGQVEAADDQIQEQSPVE